MGGSLTGLRSPGGEGGARLSFQIENSKTKDAGTQATAVQS